MSQHKPQPQMMNSLFSIEIIDDKRTKMKQKKDLRIMKMINQTKTKGILAIGEHENKNTVIDTDSDVTIGKKSRGVTKLVCLSSTQHVISTKHIAQTKEKLSSYLVKDQHNQMNELKEEKLTKKLLKREFTIIIPGQEHYLQKTAMTKSERRYDRFPSESFLTKSPSQSSVNTQSNKLSQIKFKTEGNEFKNKRGNDDEKSQRYNITSPFSVSGCDIFNIQQDTKSSCWNLQNKVEQYAEKRRDDDKSFSSISKFSKGVKLQSKSLIGGNVNLHRLMEFSENIKKYQMSKVFLIQRKWRKFFNRSFKMHSIILIQSSWRRYWLRAYVYTRIKRYYNTLAFIKHIRAYCVLFKRKYWWKFLKHQRIMPKFTSKFRNTMSRSMGSRNLLLMKPSLKYASVIQTVKCEPRLDIVSSSLVQTSRSLFKNSINESLIMSPEIKQTDKIMIDKDNNYLESYAIESKCVDIEVTPIKKKEKMLKSKKLKPMLEIENNRLSLLTHNVKTSDFEKLYNELLIDVDKMKEMLNDNITFNSKQFEVIDIHKEIQFELLFSKKIFDLPLKSKPVVETKEKEIFPLLKIKEHKEITFTYERIQQELMISLAQNNNVIIPPSHCSLFKGERVKYAQNYQLSLTSINTKPHLIKEKKHFSSFTGIGSKTDTSFNIIAKQNKEMKKETEKGILTNTSFNISIQSQSQKKKKKKKTSKIQIYPCEAISLNIINHQKIDKQISPSHSISSQNIDIKQTNEQITPLTSISFHIIPIIKTNKQMSPCKSISFNIIDIIQPSEVIRPCKSISFGIDLLIPMKKTDKVKEKKGNVSHSLKIKQYSFSLLKTDSIEDNTEFRIKQQIISPSKHIKSLLEIELSSFSIIKNRPKAIAKTKKEELFKIEHIELMFISNIQQASYIARRIKKKQIIEKIKKETTKLKIDQTSFDILNRNKQMRISYKSKKDILKIEPDSFSILKMKSMTEKSERVGMTKIDPISFDLIRKNPTDIKKKDKTAIIELDSFNAIKKQIDESKEDRLRQVEIKKSKGNESFKVELISFDIIKNKSILQKKEKERNDEFKIQLISFDIVQTKEALTKLELKSIKSKSKSMDVLKIEAMEFDIMNQRSSIVHHVLEIEAMAFDILNKETSTPKQVMTTPLEQKQVMTVKKHIIKNQAEAEEGKGTDDSLSEPIEQNKLKNKQKVSKKPMNQSPTIDEAKENEKMELIISNQVNSISVTNIAKKNHYEFYQTNSINFLPLYESKKSFKLLTLIQNESIELFDENQQKKLRVSYNNTIKRYSFSLLPILTQKKFNCQSLRIEQAITQPKQQSAQKKGSKSKTKKPQRYQPMSSLNKEKEKEKAIEQISQVVTSKYSINTPFKIQIASNNKRFNVEQIQPEKNTDFILHKEIKEANYHKSITVSKLQVEQMTIECFENNKTVALNDKIINENRIERQQNLGYIGIQLKPKSKRYQITSIQAEAQDAKITEQNLKLNINDYKIEEGNSFEIVNIEKERKQIEDDIKENVSTSYKSKRFKSKHKTNRQTKDSSKDEKLLLKNSTIRNVHTNNDSNYTINQFEIELYPQESLNRFNITNNKKENNNINNVSTSVESFVIQQHCNQMKEMLQLQPQTQFQQLQQTIVSKVLNATEKAQASLQLPLRISISFKNPSLSLPKEKSINDVNVSQSVLVSKFRKKYVLSESDDYFTTNPTEENIRYKHNEKISSINNWNNSTSFMFNCSFEVLPKPSDSNREKSGNDGSYYTGIAKTNLKANHPDKDNNENNLMQNSSDKKQLLSLSLNESIFTRYMKQRPGSNEHFTLKFLKLDSFEFTIKALYEYEELVQKILSNDKWNKISLLGLSNQDQFEIQSKYNNTIVDSLLGKKYSPQTLLIQSLLLLKLKSIIALNARQYAYWRLLEEMNKKKINEQKKAIITIRKNKETLVLKNALDKWKISHIIVRLNEKIKENKEKVIEAFAKEHKTSFCINSKERITFIIEKSHEMQCLALKKSIVLLERKENEVNIISLLKIKSTLQLEFGQENTFEIRRLAKEFKENAITSNEISIEISKPFETRNAYESTDKEINENKVIMSQTIRKSLSSSNNESDVLSIRASERMSFARQFSFGVSNDNNNIISTLNTNTIMYIEEEASPKSLRTGKRIIKPSGFNKEKANDKAYIWNSEVNETKINSIRKIVYKLNNDNNLSECKWFMLWKYNIIKKTLLISSENEINEGIEISIDYMKQGISLNKIKQIAYGNLLRSHFIKWKKSNVRTEKRRYSLRISRSNPKNEDINNQMKKMIKFRLSQTKSSALVKRILFNCITTIDQNKNDAFLLYYFYKWSGRPLVMDKTSIVRKYTVKTRIRGIFLLRKKFKYWRSLCQISQLAQTDRNNENQNENEGNYIIFIDSDHEQDYDKHSHKSKLRSLIQRKEINFYKIYFNQWKQHKPELELGLESEVLSLSNSKDNQNQETETYPPTIRIKKVKRVKEKTQTHDNSFNLNQSSHKKKKMKQYKKYIITSIYPTNEELAERTQSQPLQQEQELRGSHSTKLESKREKTEMALDTPESQEMKQSAITKVILNQLLRQSFYLFINNTLGTMQSQRHIKTYTIVIKKIKKLKSHNHLWLCFNKWKQNYLLYFQSHQRNKLLIPLNRLKNNQQSKRNYFDKWAESPIKKAIRLLIYYYNKRLIKEKEDEFREGMKKILLGKLIQWKTIILKAAKPMIYYSSSPSGKIIQFKYVTQELNSDTKSERSDDSQILMKKLYKIKTKNTKVKELLVKRILTDDFYKMRFYFNDWRSKRPGYFMNIKYKTIDIESKRALPLTIVKIINKQTTYNEHRTLSFHIDIQKYYLKWKAVSRIEKEIVTMINVKKTKQVHFHKIKKFVTQNSYITLTFITSQLLRQSLNHWRNAINSTKDNLSIHHSSSSKSNSKQLIMNYISNLHKDKVSKSYTHSSSSRRTSHYQWSLLNLFNKAIAGKFNCLHKQLYYYSKTNMVVTLIDYTIKHYAMKKIYKIALEASNDITSLQSYQVFSSQSKSQYFHIKTIAANYIQYHYRVHRRKIVRLCYLNALGKIMTALQSKDKRLTLIISFKQWKAKAKFMKNLSPTKIMYVINTFILKMKYNYFNEFIDLYVKYMKINYFINLVKEIGCSTVFKQLKINRTLKKYCTKPIEALIYSKKFFIWRRKCKLIKLKANLLLKILKVIKRNISMLTLKQLKSFK